MGASIYAPLYGIIFTGPYRKSLVGRLLQRAPLEGLSWRRCCRELQKVKSMITATAVILVATWSSFRRFDFSQILRNREPQYSQPFIQKLSQRGSRGEAPTQRLPYRGFHLQRLLYRGSYRESPRGRVECLRGLFIYRTHMKHRCFIRRPQGFEYCVFTAIVFLSMSVVFLQ